MNASRINTQLASQSRRNLRTLDFKQPVYSVSNKRNNLSDASALRARGLMDTIANDFLANALGVALLLVLWALCMQRRAPARSTSAEH
ncbi:MAG: hypothetical protein EBR09_13150 [Proteobacteria bacterium]|nr:hypothetical protein [Pseudomonadota bacterium]